MSPKHSMIVPDLKHSEQSLCYLTHKGQQTCDSGRAPTCGCDVSTEAQEKLISFTQGDLRGGLQGPTTPQSVQLPAEVSARQRNQEDAVRVIPSMLEDDGHRVAAGRGLQLLGQRSKVTRLQWWQETNYEESGMKRQREKLKKFYFIKRDWITAEWKGLVIWSWKSEIMYSWEIKEIIKPNVHTLFPTKLHLDKKNKE